MNIKTKISDGIDCYLKYIGKEAPEVIHVTKLLVKKHVIILHLSKRLYNTESLTLIVKGTYYREGIDLFEYDLKENVLYVRPCEVLKECQAEDITLIHDTPYLVQRLKDWYDLFGEYAEKHSVPNVLPQVDFCEEFDGTKKPSEEQIKAIRTSLEHPITYVCGPAGSGKTEYVLAGGLGTYIKKKQSVLLLSPTSETLEQTLSSVIPTLKDWGCDEDVVYRYGLPSSNFVSEYPKLSPKADVGRRYVENYENTVKGKLALTCHRKQEEVKWIEKKLLKLASRFDQNLIDKAEAETQKAQLVSDYEAKEKEIESIQQQLDALHEKEKKVRAKKEKNERNFLIKIFFKNSFKKQQTLLESCAQDKKQLQKKKKELEEEKNQLDKQISAIDNKIKKNFKMDTLATEMKDAASFSPELQKIHEILKLYEQGEPCVPITEPLEKILESDKAYLASNEEQCGDMLSKNDEELHNIITQAEEFLEKEEELSTNSIIVHAMTVDYFIGHFAPCEFEQDERTYCAFSHIFVDDCHLVNLAKTFPIFACNTPVTLIGDHKRGLPFFEFDSEIIKENINLSVFMLSSLYAETAVCFGIPKLYIKYFSNEDPDFFRTRRCALSNTYRYGEKEASILGKYVYEKPLVSLAAEPLEIQVIGVKKKQEKKENTNFSEARKISQYLSQNNPQDFVILTPYISQASVIGKMLPEARSDLRVMTVDSVQGRKWDTVLFSVTDIQTPIRTDSMNKRLHGENLIHTVVASAKRRLVIVCNDEIWKGYPDQLLTKFILRD